MSAQAPVKSLSASDIKALSASGIKALSASGIKALSASDIRARKGGAPLVCLTAYGTQVARLIDRHVDLILVGDSLGMVLYGQDNTLSVTLEQMIAHGAAVTRGAKRACVIVDLPFGSYQESPEQAFRNAAKVMAGTGCAGVKLEGGQDFAETIQFLTTRGVPVLGHIGLMPQMVASVGGFLTQGRTDEEAAAKNPFFEGRVAHGYLIVSFAAGLFVDPDFGPVLANYGVDNLRFLTPLNYGETMSARLTCKQKTLRGDSGYGEVRWDAEVTNQDDEIVAQYDVLTMVATNEHWESVQ